MTTCLPVSVFNLFVAQSTPEINDVKSVVIHSFNACRYTDSEWRERKEDKSLEGLLTLARREMEQEKLLKKVDTQYYNNSRLVLLSNI